MKLIKSTLVLGLMASSAMAFGDVGGSLSGKEWGGEVASSGLRAPAPRMAWLESDVDQLQRIDSAALAAHTGMPAVAPEDSLDSRSYDFTIRQERYGAPFRAHDEWSSPSGHFHEYRDGFIRQNYRHDSSENPDFFKRENRLHEREDRLHEREDRYLFGPKQLANTMAFAHMIEAAEQAKNRKAFLHMMEEAKRAKQQQKATPFGMIPDGVGSL